MTLLDTIVSNFYGGVAKLFPVKIEVNEGSDLHQTMSRVHSFMYMSDAMIKRYIPECIDDGTFVFIEEKLPWVYTIALSDVERCWYDKMGMPEMIHRFLSGVMIIDDRGGAIDAGRTADDPHFKMILNKNINHIKII